jgi:hypothetical protein
MTFAYTKITCQNNLHTPCRQFDWAHSCDQDVKNGFVSSTKSTRTATKNATALLVSGHIRCMRAITIETELIFNMQSGGFHVKSENIFLAIYATNWTMEVEREARVSERANFVQNLS